jgi:hypothetical protein
MLNLSFKGSPQNLMKYINSKICEFCYGDGVLYFMESDREGHYTDTGMKTCQCQMVETEDRVEEQ